MSRCGVCSTAAAARGIDMSDLRARRFELALALANERCGLKPSSPQNWKLAARALRGLGQHERAERAEARSDSLMAA